MFLEFALTCRESGIPASEWLEMTGADAFSINHAVMRRCATYDLAKDKILAHQLAKASWGTTE